MHKALADLRKCIRLGDFDTDLDEVMNTVITAVARRRVAVRDGLIGDFAVGMRVLTLPGNYKPRYFANREGTIVSIEEGTVWIELDEPIRRQRGTIKNIGISGVEYLEIIE
jgi:hypothetical protein